MINYTLISKLTPNLDGHSRVSGCPYSNGIPFDLFLEQNMFKKVELSNEVSDDIATEALNQFRDSNQRCRMINESFSSYFSHPELSAFLLKWRENVATFLKGVHISFRNAGALTSGASSSTPRGALATQRLDKLQVSSALLNSPFWGKLPFSHVEEKYFLSFVPVSSDPTGCVQVVKPVWKNNALNYSVSDVLSPRFVPKTFSEARVVWPEPAANMYAQRCIGLAMSKALRRTHLDTRYAKDEHMAIAKYGSIFGRFSTLDLSRASDLIAFELTKWLAPPHFGGAMESSRSAAFYYGDEVIPLSMSSTMGNGFCWEWETIVFYTFLQTIRDTSFPDVFDSQLRCFGDDMIYPVEMHDTVLRFAAVFGWQVNQNKSFSSGFFRESCGGDFYMGQSVRPVYCKSGLMSTREKFRLYNRIVEMFGESPQPLYLLKALGYILSDIEPNDRLFGPSHYGDSVLWSSDPDLYTIKRTKTKDLIKVLVSKTADDDYVSVGTTSVAPAAFSAAVHFFALRGHGLVWLPFPVKEKGKPKVGPDGRLVTELRFKHPQVPAPGAGVLDQPGFVPLYYTSNGVDERDPLSIFDIPSGMSMRIKVRSEHWWAYKVRGEQRLAAIIAALLQQHSLNEARLSASLINDFSALLESFDSTP